MEKLYKNSETGCCPRFDPKPWDGKKVTWKNKLFLKDHVWSFFHIPLNFGGVMKKNMEIIGKAGALAKKPLMLSDEKFMWGSDIYIEVSKTVPNAEMVKLSGTFLTKVYEGPFKDTGKWCKDFEAYAKGKNLKIKKWYMWYTTCPRCAKYYGKNYTVIVGQV